MSTAVISAKLPLALPAEQFGPLGLSLDATPDSSDGQQTRLVPLITVIWMDERQTCLRVLQFVHNGQLPDLPGCPQYHAGMCARGNGRTCPAPCLFHEPAVHPTWTRATGWQYDPVSASVIARPLWPEFGLEETTR